MEKRQLQIFSHLVNESNWITSEKLAELIGVNKKTIQIEIKDLMDEFGENLILEVNRRLGYRLLKMETQLQEVLVEEMQKHDLESTLNFRTSTLLVHLLFQEEFVSMQALAETFYLSKTAISLEVKTMKRWIDRNAGITLVVSGTEGLKIEGPEECKRYFFSSISSAKVIEEAKLGEALTVELLMCFDLLSELFQTALLTHQYIISGADYLRLARYLTGSLVRSRWGLNLEGNDADIAVHEGVGISDSESSQEKLFPVVETLQDLIEDRLSVLLNPREALMVSNWLLELNPLENIYVQDFELERTFDRFEQVLIEFLHLPTHILFRHREIFLSHLKQMIIRFNSGHSLSNISARKTAQSYPLEMYLVRHFIPRYFSVRPNDAENAYLALYMAEALEPFKHSYTALLVSNEQVSVLNTLSHQLRKMSHRQLVEVKVEPSYVFELKQDQTDYDFRFSTEEAITMQYSNFYYIDRVLTAEKLNNLALTLQGDFERVRQEKVTSVLQRYFLPGNDLLIEKKIDSLQQLFPQGRGLTMQTTGAEELLVLFFKEGRDSRIQRYRLKKPILYQQRPIKQLVFAEWDLNQQEGILDFFEAVGEVVKGIC